MSPEQATADRELDARSDVYSLGAVVYEMLAGEPPYTGPTAQSIIAKLMIEPARRLSLARPTIPPGVEAAIHKSLEKLPADRFASADQFAEALRRPVALAEPAAVGAVAVPRSRSRVVVALAIVGWVLVAGLAAMLLRGGRRGMPVDEPVRRYDIVLPDSAPLDFFAPSLYGTGLPALAISPDGGTLMYVARRGTGT
jgi:serine/threonine-protein kinase